MPNFYLTWSSLLLMPLYFLVYYFSVSQCKIPPPRSLQNPLKTCLPPSMVLVQQLVHPKERTQLDLVSKVQGSQVQHLIAVLNGSWNLCAKLYIPSTINSWRKLLSTAIWVYKNGLVSGRLACSSSKTKNLKNIIIYIWILNLLRMYFKKVGKWNK